MRRDTGNKVLFILLFVCLGLGLYFFYLKYVPLVKGYQLVLMPILLAVFLTSLFNDRIGVFLFVFLFPLISNFPYFFGIYENTPHAPSALVLFLVLLLGWLCHRIFFKPKVFVSPKIVRPIVLFSILVGISGLITFIRYTNFYPFISDSVYELVTNVNGVSAGGALMSVTFTSLNYLSGFAFFIMLLNTVRSRDTVRTIIILFLISSAFALVFGVYQNFGHGQVGNSPKWFERSLINATFKDPLAFGVYLAILIPVCVGVFLAFRGSLRLFAILLSVLAVYFLPQTTSKSALGALLIALLIVLIVLITKSRVRAATTRKIIGSGVILLLIFSVAFSVLVISKDSTLHKRFTEFKRNYDKGGIEKALGIRWSNRWKMAVLMMKDYPLTGVGVGAYIVELPNYVKINDGVFERTDSAENYLLQAGSELGLMGLFCVLWILWEIFGKFRRAFSQQQSREQWWYIQWGIVCGIIVFFVNFIFHTYIGNFEIKYTFWFLMALLFVLQRGGVPEKSRPLFGKKSVWLVSAFVLFFSVGHIWNSTHSLSLKSQMERFGFKQFFGLYRMEKTDDGREFCWTREYGGSTFQVKGSIMQIPILASHPDIQETPVVVKVYLVKELFRERRLLGELVITSGVWNTYNFRIPDEVGQEVLLLIKVNRTWNPQKFDGTPDPRNLGVAIGEIQFKE